jgi:hypothetical protein
VKRKKKVKSKILKEKEKKDGRMFRRIWQKPAKTSV